jgi:superfamily II DNA or RNA helicase
MNYADFLKRKQRVVAPAGKHVIDAEIHGTLHEWQRDIVAWACDRGRAAIFADCGLGKTFMQLEWARLMHTRGALIVAPLSVARQTVREARKIDIDIAYTRETPPGDGGMWITNYEMLHEIDPARFDAVVLDESSILKNYVGRTRTQIIDAFRDTPYRLACTATPAPNDVAELTNHAEFLGVMTRQDMLGAYFITDMDNKSEGGGYRVKGHAKVPMFSWMAQWAAAIRKPSDLGHDDTGYDLPPLRVHPEIVDVEITPDGQLFATELGGVGGRATVRRATLDARVERAAQLAASNCDQWILWAGLNDEADALAKAIDGSVNVEGSWTPDAKAEALEAFQDGDIRVLITKPSIAGFGMNFQNAHRMAFVGMGDSYEAYYQSIRRCYRFGQTEPVDVHIVLSELEQQIAHNVARKERSSSEATDLLVKYQSITALKEIA